MVTFIKKLVWTFMKVHIAITFVKTMSNRFYENIFSVESTENRLNRKYSEITNWIENPVSDSPSFPDYMIVETRRGVWELVVSDDEFLNIATVSPAAIAMGTLTPFVTGIPYYIGDELISGGYIIVVPSSIKTMLNTEEYNFCIQHELGHIISGHLEPGYNVTKSEIVRREIEADNFAKGSCSIDGTTASKILGRLHQYVMESSINAIPSLKRRYSKLGHMVKYDSALTERQAALIA